MNLTIAIPSRGVCNPAFAHALKMLNVPKPFTSYQVVYVPGADISVARNVLVNKALGDYILFLDDDVLPPNNAIEKLISHKKDIVTGLYFSRRQPFYPQIHTISKENEKKYDAYAEYPKDSLIEVDACGMGCILVKKSVFDKIKEPYFKTLPSGGGKKIGEDFYFCKQVKKVGYNIYCDTSVIALHVGEIFIGPQYWESNYQKIRELKKTMTEEEFAKYKEGLRKLDNRR